MPCSIELRDSSRMGKVVGWFQGRMEFGPRALGARSILGEAEDLSRKGAKGAKVNISLV